MKTEAYYKKPYPEFTPKKEGEYHTSQGTLTWYPLEVVWGNKHGSNGFLNPSYFFEPADVMGAEIENFTNKWFGLSANSYEDKNEFMQDLYALLKEFETAYLQKPVIPEMSDEEIKQLIGQNPILSESDKIVFACGAKEYRDWLRTKNL